MAKHNRRNQKNQPQGSDASPNNIPRSSMPASEQQAEMSQKAYRQPLQSLLQQQHHGPGSSTPHPSFQESGKQSVSIHQQSALPEPPVNDHNSLIKLVSDLYWSANGVLPPQHRPNQDSILRTLNTWTHLYVPTGPDLSVRTRVIAKLQEEMAIGKVADVVYILVEINNHRNQQRNQQTQDLLKRAALVLEMPTVARKLTAMDNPYLTDDKFQRATPGMRFHIYSRLLETYIGVLGIGAAVWGIRKMQLELAMEENGTVKDATAFGYLNV